MNSPTFLTITPEQIATLAASTSRPIDQLIIHCSGVRPGQTSSARQIDAWHRARGWRMIGYHFVIRRNGCIETGRPLAQAGAHTRGHNAHSIGICYEGGLDDEGKAADTRTLEQRRSLVALIRGLKTLYPHATIHGHNEFARKACPCFDTRELTEL